MSNEKVEGEVKPLGRRLTVPSKVLKSLALESTDKVVWEIKEEGGEKIAVLKKKKNERR